MENNQMENEIERLKAKLERTMSSANHMIEVGMENRRNMERVGDELVEWVQKCFKNGDMRITYETVREFEALKNDWRFVNSPKFIRWE